MKKHAAVSSAARCSPGPLSHARDAALFPCAAFLMRAAPARLLHKRRWRRQQPRAAAQQTPPPPQHHRLYSGSDDPISSFGFSRGLANKYEMGERVGAGTFGVVHAAVHRETGQRCAAAAAAPVYLA
jgi:hypothetical protein